MTPPHLPDLAPTTEFYESCGVSKREARKFARYPSRIYARAVNRALDSFYLRCSSLLFFRGEDPRIRKLGQLMLKHFQVMEATGVYTPDSVYDPRIWSSDTKRIQSSKSVA